MPTKSDPSPKRRRRPALVVEVSLQDPVRDHDVHVSFLGHDFRLVRVGTGGGADEAAELATKWATHAQAIAVTGGAEALDPGGLGVADVGVPVTTGTALREVLQEWAIRHLQSTMPGYFDNARVAVLGGPGHHVETRVLREFTANITPADPRLLDLLGEFEALPLLGEVATAALRPAHHLPGRVQSALHTPGPIASAAVHRAARDADVIVATYAELDAVGIEHLSGKAVITGALSDHELAELAGRGVDLVLETTPQPFDFLVEPAVLEAMMLTETTGPSGDLLETIVKAGLEPRVRQPNGPRRKSRFAFVIHPLSQGHFANVEPLRTISKVAPGVVMDAVEKVVAYAPPFTYTHITGIKSPTGAEAEGWLIAVGGTPSQLLAHRPEFTYSRLLAAADISRRLGAQIMGLGAFTKVVGDAGVTVAKQASLPVTTGNSYSASATLWAAHEALQRLGLVEVGPDGTMHGKTMVVGATGSIGSVCARLLALASDEVWLVSPERAKLLALKEAIERDRPRAKVHLAATPGRHVATMDLIVTATSAAGARVLDIMAVKPGCVITDVARPLDLSAEDVARRPDVLVVESGEIELPGDVHMKNIGLPPGVAYACLAETVVLALEGRYEQFTVGRDIDWERVKEIYRLGLKHGMKLATISGVNGPFTDDDIAAIRARAHVALAGPKVGV
ncbi:MAG TPA: hypothetical protein VGN18_03590 [Jatrophihabitans sp.]|jgi:predicted amino acid dehydrogenase|uniref:hypothetical protein n=1 Tax=Jatrophihabitans sp. TaxID=1932789 RepID=UPI002E0878D6|nr:hypothetical protein [Jatrophihabitans sp.]